MKNRYLFKNIYIVMN